MALMHQSKINNSCHKVIATNATRDDWPGTLHVRRTLSSAASSMQSHASSAATHGWAALLTRNERWRVAQIVAGGVRRVVQIEGQRSPNAGPGGAPTMNDAAR